MYVYYDIIRGKNNKGSCGLRDLVMTRVASYGNSMSTSVYVIIYAMSVLALSRVVAMCPVHLYFSFWYDTRQCTQLYVISQQQINYIKVRSRTRLIHDYCRAATTAVLRPLQYTR